MSENKEYLSDQGMTGDGQSCCEGGDCCPTGSGGSGKTWKMVVFLLVIVASGAVLARSLLSNSNSDSTQSQQTFASIQTDSEPDTPSLPKATEKAGMSIESEIKIETPPVVVETEKQDVSVKAASSLWKADLDSLASLNKVATETDAVFVFLTAGGPQNLQPVTSQIESAAKTIESNGVKISAFRLKQTAPEYAQLAKQASVPSVLVMVKGGGMSAVSGEISEAKLVQAFVTASRPTSGCCPPGTDSTACPPQ